MKIQFLGLFILLAFNLSAQSERAVLRGKAYQKLDIANDYDSALHYASLLKAVSLTPLELADHAILEGKINYVSANLSEAILSYKKAIGYDSLSYLAPYAYIGLAISYKDLGEYDKAIEYYQRATSRFEISKDEDEAAKTKKLVASLYLDIGELDKAEQIYTALLTYFPPQSDEKASIYNNLGGLYYDKEDYRKAF